MIPITAFAYLEISWIFLLNFTISILQYLVTDCDFVACSFQDFDDTEHKRPCAEESQDYSYAGTSAGFPEELKGEKRALETSNNSESSFQQVPKFNKLYLKLLIDLIIICKVLGTDAVFSIVNK